MAPAAPTTMIEIHNLVKDHQALRPLRMRSLAVAAGEIVAISGLDAVAAEVFVNLVTGATLADTGDVALFGQNTRDILNTGAWIRSLEGLAMVSERAVMIESFTPLQNIAMPITLAVDPIEPDVLPRALALAREVGLAEDVFDQPVGRLTPAGKMRTHMARALALEPRLLIAEHPTALLPRDAVAAFGEDLARVARQRKLALVVLTADGLLARAVGGRRLALNPATGELKREGSWVQRFMGS
jgi:predicted ABC-type transport system involved in lysophospholipase L1 biosynthesis ATPase subunit